MRGLTLEPIEFQHAANMSATSPMFANGIDLPLLLIWGVIVIVPLMVFQVGVESLILSHRWQLGFRELLRCVFLANCWSLLAGIPVKIFNAWLYSLMLPADLAGFFARYPFAVFLGTIVYLVVTWLVESRYLLKWLERGEHAFSWSRVRSAVLLANLATYSVLGPVHYFATRPIHNIREFTMDTRWASQPPAQIIYVDTRTRHLKSVYSDGSRPDTIVPLPVVDYQLSADLNLCVFRGPDGFLHLYRRGTGEQNLVWKTQEHFLMEQVAFSPTGRFVAWFSESAQRLEVNDLQSSKRWTHALEGDRIRTRVVWSVEESKFVISTSGKSVLIQVTPENGLQELKVSSEVLPPLLAVYGRVGSSGYRISGDEWGPVYDTDVHAELKASTFPGFTSSFRLYRTNDASTRVVSLSVNPGLLHFPHYDFRFDHPSFLADGHECLFETRNDIYLLDIERKRVGRVAQGHSFILLTSRYSKKTP